MFRVLDRVTGETRALKRARLQGASSARIEEAFEREYQTLASLDHPRIIRVFDYGVDEQGPFYTMELLGGSDLRRSERLPYRQACACLRDVATSLALLHARRLLHRDVSPGNVRMTADGRCKLIDFGALASFGVSEVVAGTPPAVAPEALSGGSALDQRVDLFALGALAYWVLTGTHAYPAYELAELPTLWRAPPQPPSAYVADVPPALDALVLSLLHLDPLARPESAAEVIGKLESIAELPPETAADTQLLLQSFLLRPRFVGRTEELAQLNALRESAQHGSGAALCVRAGAGMGSSRLLDELGMCAKRDGALELRADAGVARQVNGLARALVQRLFESAPELGLSLAYEHRGALAALGGDVAQRYGVLPFLPPQLSLLAHGMIEARGYALEALFVAASRQRPIVMLIDDVPYADDASIGMLAALASQSSRSAILVVVSERALPAGPVSMGLAALRGHCREQLLPQLSERDTTELVRSLFGGAPNAERFAEWLHERTAGTPLYALAVCRQLIAAGIIRYEAGMWSLPTERPDARLPSELGEAMTLRLLPLREGARRLAECLCLLEEAPSAELCRLLVARESPGNALSLLAELARHDVLLQTEDGFRWSSSAIREALGRGMDELRLQHNHKRLGDALAQLARGQEQRLMLRAGWHLIKGEDGERGADMIAAVASDSYSLLTLAANLHRPAAVLEAALTVYANQRHSLYRRLPLLAGLAYCGYYEDRVWGVRYGDQALDALEELGGLRVARRMRPILGGWGSALLGLLSASLRFHLTPKAERPYGFSRLFVQLCAAVTALTGAAALSLDAPRAARVAATLEPYAVFPQRITFVGVYQFCQSLQQIALENQPSATLMFETLLERFQDKRYYPSLPDDARGLYVAGLQFALGAFSVFKADGSRALRCADALDGVGLKLYAMIASQLRYLYFTMRGELGKAAPHRAQVELHAAQVGSAWQVENWEAPALLLLHMHTSDTVETTRLTHRLSQLSKSVPSLRRYQRLAVHMLQLFRSAPRVVEGVVHEYNGLAPRGLIGWAATLGLVARAYNEVGQHQKAKQLCEDALAQLSDEHREYVSLFMVLELQLVLAQGGLGDTAGALERIDAQLERFAGCDHPLLAGMLHDARARLCWAKGDVAGFERSLAEVEREFRRTGVSALVAHAERLALLARPRTPANTQEEGALRSSSRRPPRPTTGELSEVATVVAPKAATRARS